MSPDLKPWYAVATPHEDIRTARMQEAVFAANLWAVYPRRLFPKSCRTRGMLVALCAKEEPSDEPYATLQRAGQNLRRLPNCAGLRAKTLAFERPDPASRFRDSSELLLTIISFRAKSSWAHRH